MMLWSPPGLPAGGMIRRVPPEGGCSIMIAAMVAPCWRWSISSTRVCFESRLRGFANSCRTSPLLFLRVADPPRRPLGYEVARILGLVRLLGLAFGDARLDADRGEAVRSDAQGQRSGVVVTPPDRQRANGTDFFDQPVAQKLADGLFGLHHSQFPRCSSLQSQKFLPAP